MNVRRSAVVSILSSLHYGLLMICLRVRELNIPSSASLIYQTQSEVIHLKVNARKPELTIYFRVRALIDSRHSSLRHQRERLQAHEVYLTTPNTTSDPPTTSIHLQRW
jgi:hypothetical protein